MQSHSTTLFTLPGANDRAVAEAKEVFQYAPKKDFHKTSWKKLPGLGGFQYSSCTITTEVLSGVIGSGLYCSFGSLLFHPG